jgi:hypothetical protein
MKPKDETKPLQMTEAQAKAWVLHHANDEAFDGRELEAAYATLFGPWSLSIRATAGAPAEQTPFYLWDAVVFLSIGCLILAFPLVSHPVARHWLVGTSFFLGTWATFAYLLSREDT